MLTSFSRFSKNRLAMEHLSALHRRGIINLPNFDSVKEEVKGVKVSQQGKDALLDTLKSFGITEDQVEFSSQFGDTKCSFQIKDK